MVKGSLLSLCLAALLHLATCFTGNSPSNLPGLLASRNPRICSSSEAAQVLHAGARRSQRGLFGLRLAVEQAKVESLTKKAEEGSGSPQKGPQKIFKALKKPTGAPTVALEFRRKEGLEHKSMEELSLTIRRAKYAVIIVDGTNVPDVEADVEAFVKEQASAKGNFPGPTPVVWRGGISSFDDIGYAAAMGCSGVSLNAEELGERLPEMIRATLAVDMEPVVEVQDKEQIDQAKEAGAKILQVRFGSAAVQSFMTLAAIKLKPDIPKDMAAVATVIGRQGGSEIKYANQLLDAGYNGVQFSGMIEDPSDDNNSRYIQYVYAVCTSKRSSKIKINEAKGGGKEYNGADSWGTSGTHV